MSFTKSFAIITLYLVSGVLYLGKAQIPVIIKCENNAKTVAEARIQITNPAGVVKAWDIKDLKNNILECNISGAGEVGVFIQYKEKMIKSTFIKRTFMVTGEEKGIAIFSSINLKDMTILCGNEYSNRRYCVLDIRKYYPEELEGNLPSECENFSEKTAFWNYSIRNIISRK